MQTEITQALQDEINQLDKQLHTALTSTLPIHA